MENKQPVHLTLNPCCMKLITAAFITLLGITVLLIVSFKHISAETSIKAVPHNTFTKAKPAKRIGGIPQPNGLP